MSPLTIIAIAHSVQCITHWFFILVALSFCINRLNEIESFEPNKYWKVQIDAKLLDGKSYPLGWKKSTLDAVEDTRKQNQNQEIYEKCATYNQQSANRVVEQANGSDIVVSAVTKSSNTISPP